MKRTILFLLTIQSFQLTAASRTFWEIHEAGNVWEADKILSVKAGSDGLLLLVLEGPEGATAELSNVDFIQLVETNSDPSSREPKWVSTEEVEERLSRIEEERTTGGTLGPYQGRGNQVLGPISMKEGLWIGSYSVEGDGFFSAEILDASGEKVDILTVELTSSQGSNAVQIKKSGKYFLNISATDLWSLLLETPRMESEERLTTSRASG